MTTPAVNNRYIVPDIAEFFFRRMRDVSASINCCLIGTVISFDATNQTIQAAVNFQKVIKNVVPIPANIGEMADLVVDYPNLVNVPVFIYQGGGAYLTMPVGVGDSCVIFFHDRDMDIWVETGLVGPPNSERVHNMNDAIAFIGIRNFQESIANYNTLIASLIDSTGERLTQAGMVIDFAGSTAPSGWLLCYGQSLAKSSYPILFSVIGYTYGGSGTNFNIPDCRGRTTFGLDNMGGTDANRLAGSGATTDQFTLERDVLGGVVGECMHTQTVPELVSHLHTWEAEGGASNGSGTADSRQEGTGTPSNNNTSNTGGGLPFNVIPNALMFNKIIKV